MNKSNWKKKKRAKNICPDCHKKMKKDYEECMNCGGSEFYYCSYCGKTYDTETGKEL